MGFQDLIRCWFFELVSVKSGRTKARPILNFVKLVCSQTALIEKETESIHSFPESLS